MQLKDRKKILDLAVVVLDRHLTTVMMRKPAPVPSLSPAPLIDHQPNLQATVNQNHPYYDEHRRIFGYQPSKVYLSKRAIKGKGKGKKKAVGTWMKEVICLKDWDQDTAPNTEEKIELA